MTAGNGRNGPTSRVRGAFQWPVVVLLAAVWVLLWGELTTLNVVSGVVVAVAVLAVFPLPPIERPARIRPLGLVRLTARFGYDLLVASVQVAVLALRFGHQPRSAVIEVRLRSRSDLLLTLTAELVSLVPGSLLIETSHPRSVLFLHVLGVGDAAAVERARRNALEQERRVVEAFATAADLATYRENLRAEETG